MAIAAVWSSKQEARVGLGEGDGSKNSFLGAESWWIERCDMVYGYNKRKGKRKDKIKERTHEQTRFEDNCSNRSPATAPEMLVGIS